MADSNIRIGTSGWSYPSGAGTWNGLFYPPTGRRHRAPGFDELAFYADHFDTVEVNSTFYRIPTPQVTRSWARRTPAGFEFSIKLFQKFTHPSMFKQATGRETWDVGMTDVDAVRVALDPIQQAGKLGVVLAQFPPSFKNSSTSRDYLEWLVQAFAGWPVAVELRHRSWSDNVGASLTLLNELGAGWVQIDEPKFRFSIAQNYLPNVTTLYYMRLHGRNAANWWRHDRAEDRYDYLYSATELKPFAETADAASRIVRKLYLYLNNHFAAKSVANAVALKQLLGMPIEGDYSEAFVSRYPELEGLVARQSARDRVLPLTEDSFPRG